jgi:hypothetical protein
MNGVATYPIVSRSGANSEYVPVPLGDFQVTASASLLVLDTTKSAMDAAPLVKEDQFFAPGTFREQSEKEDHCRNTPLTVTTIASRDRINPAGAPMHGGLQG